MTYFKVNSNLMRGTWSEGYSALDLNSRATQHLQVSVGRESTYARERDARVEDVIQVPEAQTAEQDKSCS
jgi:hypothetical protein